MYDEHNTVKNKTSFHISFIAIMILKLLRTLENKYFCYIPSKASRFLHNYINNVYQ